MKIPSYVVVIVLLGALTASGLLGSMMSNDKENIPEYLRIFMEKARKHIDAGKLHDWALSVLKESDIRMTIIPIEKWPECIIRYTNIIGRPLGIQTTGLTETSNQYVLIVYGEALTEALTGKWPYGIVIKQPKHVIDNYPMTRQVLWTNDIYFYYCIPDEVEYNKSKKVLNPTRQP